MNEIRWIDNDYATAEQRDVPQIRLVLIITMVLNFAATAVKMAAGLATGSLSVIADGLDSLFDGLSNVGGLAGLSASAKPPDAAHPYGRRKYETLAALAIAILLFLSCYQLLVSAWERFGSHASPQVNIWTAAAMGASMLIQVITSTYELRAGRRLKSEILVADAMHTRASILISLSVLGGLGLVKLGYPIADPILAVFVALVIAKIGVDVLRETLPVLVDQAAIDPDQIAAVVNTVGGIESFHRVRSRGPLGNVAVDLHVRVSPERTLQEADTIADEVRRRLLALTNISDVTVHVEPQRGTPANASDIFATLKHAAAELGLTIHEVYAYRDAGDVNIEIHVGVEPNLTLGEAHSLVDHLEREVHVRLPELNGIHTHIEVATSQVEPGDQAPPEVENQVRTQVEQIVGKIPMLSNPHNIRVHRHPTSEDQLFISLECAISPDTPVTQAHYLATIFERELSRRMNEAVEVSVHLEPPDESP